MSDSPYGWWLPPDISTYGPSVDHLINTLHWFMAIIFIGWGAFLLYCLVRFRARPGHAAEYNLPKAKVSKLVEIGVAAFEAFLLIGLSMPVWAAVKTDFPPESEHPLHVRVVAEQFAWNFHYSGEDGIFGRTDPALMGADNLIGLDEDDENAADDVVTNNEFHIPVDRPIIAELTSKDVIHSFFIPVMRVKQDVIPGMKVPVWFEAIRTGHFEVACAQLCGNNHYLMKADLYVDTASDFDDWLSERASDADEEEEEDEDDDA